ncbi:hypothetical protein DWX20_00925 [Solobacterium moorei]|uniref:Uncharacterized protein n=1 Tax=Solobacterium moorei TaxID=102148 RepID=A0A412PHK2_9FIRM|nr:hypothetical protein DWX20_00925 [Solobacterium moorei]
MRLVVDLCFFVIHFVINIPKVEHLMPCLMVNFYGDLFRGNRILAAKLEEVLTQRSPTDSN